MGGSDAVAAKAIALAIIGRGAVRYQNASGVGNGFASADHRFGDSSVRAIHATYAASWPHPKAVSTRGSVYPTDRRICSARSMSTAGGLSSG